MTKLKIGIFGAGALGSLVGAYLSKDYEITLYGRPSHMKEIETKGLRITGVNGEEKYGLRAVSEINDEYFDLAIIGVKSYHTKSLLRDLERQRVKFGLVASIQNGLKDEELVSSFGLERVLGCVINEAAGLVREGHVEYSNQGASFFGVYKKENDYKKLEVAESLASSLENKVLKAGISSDIGTLTWYKFMICVPGFAVSGALNYRAVELFTNPFARLLFLDSLRETKKVALSEGIKLTEHPLLNDLFLVEEKEQEKILEELGKQLSLKETSPVSSLVQDLRAGKHQTEAEETIGVLLSKAAGYGEQAPVNAVCYQMIKAREAENHQKVKEL